MIQGSIEELIVAVVAVLKRRYMFSGVYLRIADVFVNILTRFCSLSPTKN